MIKYYTVLIPVLMINSVFKISLNEGIVYFRVPGKGGSNSSYFVNVPKLYFKSILIDSES